MHHHHLSFLFYHLHPQRQQFYPSCWRQRLCESRRITLLSSLHCVRRPANLSPLLAEIIVSMHLRQVFTLFLRAGIALKPSKSFVGYPNMQLLGQRVDSFGLSTPQERLAAISKLEFPRTLTALETYLDITGYFRKYIA